MTLKNKVAIVTGARQGIGKGIALTLAAQGCRVVVSDLDQSGCQSVVKEIEALYGNGIKKINDLTLPTLNMYGSKCSLYSHESKVYSEIIEEVITVYDKKDYCDYVLQHKYAKDYPAIECL